MEPFIKINDSYELTYLDKTEKLRTNRHNNPIYKNIDILYKTNSLGYRCDHSFSLLNNDYILAFGCSHTYGVGLSKHHRWSDIVEKYIDIPVFNVSMCGSSPNFVKDNFLHLLKSHYKKPKAIFVQWPERNRLTVDNLRIFPNNKEFENLYKSDWFEKYSDRAHSDVNWLCDTFNIKKVEFSIYPTLFDITTIHPIDLARDGDHPGIDTNDLFAQFIIKGFKK
jgi:hypothetical protein